MGIMTPARFGFQALIVLILVALVSWPEQRRVRAGDLWHALDGARRPDGAGPSAGRAGGGRSVFGYGLASEVRLGAQAAAAIRRKLFEGDLEGRRRPLPPALQMLGGKVNGIVGYARGARNAPIASARLLLRDASTGQVQAPASADEYGRFAFLDMLPGGYVVELLDSNGAVVGTSEFITIGLNELRQTVVRGSGRMALTSFGGALRPTASDTIAAATSQGVNRVSAPSRCASPPCDNP
jgi:hypothetical protein